MNQEEIEIELLEKFSLLFESGESILLDIADISFLRCGIMNNGKVLLIQVNNENSPYSTSIDSKFVDTIGKIKMEYVDIQLIDAPISKYVSISCKNGRLFQIFIRILADLIWHLLYGIDRPIDGDPWNFLNERLKSWKLILTSDRSKDEEKGLIGELVLLKYLKENFNHNINIWEGPIGGVKDLRLQNCDIEVKSTSNRYGYKIEISGLFQTQQQQENNYLYFLRLEETINGNISIPDLITQIKILCNNEEKIEFAEKLNLYSEEIIISNNKWNILEEKFIKIDDQFPRIYEESFKENKLPKGIVQISWVADLSFLPKISKENFDLLNSI